MVPAARAALRLPLLQHGRRHLVRGLHLRRADVAHALPAWRDRHGPAENDLPCARHAHRGRLASKSPRHPNMLPSISADSARTQGHTKLPDYVPVGQFAKTPFRDLFTAASSDCLNLLGKCLIYDPRRRISAKDVSIENISAATIMLAMLTSTLGPQPSLLLRPPVPHAPLQAPEAGEERGRRPARGGRRQR